MTSAFNNEVNTAEGIEQRLSKDCRRQEEREREREREREGRRVRERERGGCWRV